MPLREYITTQEAERLERAVKEIEFVSQNLQPGEPKEALKAAVAAAQHVLKDQTVNNKGRDNKARFIAATKRHQRREKMTEKEAAERELAAKLKAKEEAERLERETPTLVTGLAPEEGPSDREASPE